MNTFITFLKRWDSGIHIYSTCGYDRDILVLNTPMYTHKFIKLSVTLEIINKHNLRKVCFV